MNRTLLVLMSLTLLSCEPTVGLAANPQSSPRVRPGDTQKQRESEIQYLNQYGRQALLQAVIAGDTQVARELLNDSMMSTLGTSTAKRL